MVAHKYPTGEGLGSSPPNVQHYQIRGHSRNNPHLTLPSQARLDRINMLTNAPHCTIPLRFENMMKAYLPPVDVDGFQAVYSKGTILGIHVIFKAKLGSPDDADEGRKGDNVQDGQSGEVRAQDDQVKRKRAKKKKVVREDPITEKSVSEAWRKAFDEKTLCPGYLLNISETRADETDTKKYKIDGALISTADEDLVVEGRPNFFLDDLPIEFKRGETKYDPWDDHAKKDMEPEAFTRSGVRGQVMSYGERIYFYQHRTGLFMLLVNGGEFRVIRWDRSGCIVTEALNYVDSIEGTKKLLEFFYAYSKATPEQRGFDPTATRLSKDSCGWKWMRKVAAKHDLDVDYEDETVIQLLPQGFVTEPRRDAPSSSLFATNVLTDNPASEDGFGDLSAPSTTSTIAPVFKYVRDLFRASLAKTWLCYSLQVCGRDYLVGEPVFAPQGLIGRGTRGYVALEWKTQRLVFLKDAWRPFYEGVDQEGATLATLNAAEVSSVPTLVCHEDETEASQYSSTGSKQRDVFGEDKKRDASSEEKKDRPIAPLPRSRSKGSEPNVPATKKTRQSSSGGSNGASETQTSSGSNGNRSTEAAVGGGVSQGSGGGSGKRPLPEDTTPVPPQDGLGLRHMTHYRIVVAEILLPSTEIKSGAQLMRVVWDCMTAHQEAVVKCGIIHRDVSTGNILIRPQVVCVDPETGESVVIWSGVLSDWELAKPLPKDDKSTRARQPHRTGTWYYMSVCSLTYPERPVSIADELESFLHVMIYLAIRLLRTSFVKASAFVDEYFEGYYKNDKDWYTCSHVKKMIIRSGSLTWNENPIDFLSAPLPEDQPMRARTNVEYLSPLNDVIAKYLKYFKAHYAVLDYEIRDSKDGPEPAPSPQSVTKVATPLSASADRMRNLHLARYLKKGFPVLPASERNVATPTDSHRLEKPEQAVYDMAAKLKSHDKILDMLAMAMNDRDWPSDDYAGDQLVGYIPHDMQSAAKRARLQMSVRCTGTRHTTNLQSIPEAEELPDRAHTAA